MTKRVKLVLSLSRVINEVVRGTISADELGKALFFVGGRERITNPEGLKSMIRGSYGDAARQGACEQLLAALDGAERERRIIWRTDSDPWGHLNVLLIQNQLPRIEPYDGDIPPKGRYAYPFVREAVRQQNLPYELIW